MSPSTPNSTNDTDSRARRTMGVVFFTIIMDIVGFSIIFPLYPSMLTYYLGREGDSGVLGALLGFLERFDSLAGGGVVVLFGGVLGSLYAILQFVGAPIFGAVSDRIGRKPILLFSLSGLAISYVLWIVAGQFWILLVARFVGGLMSSNISTATAVVADITTPDKRARGMAMVGMALGMGFMLGPALGGLAAGWDWAAQWPELERFGINPFSFPAALAAMLAIINVMFVAFAFRETRDPSIAPPSVSRTANPIALFRTADYPGVSQTNLTYFIFLAAFSGMEFSITFLAAERFDYGPRGIALMLLFAGVILAVMQGGYVRRMSERIGPRRMTFHGLAFTIPGLIVVGSASQPWMAFAGLGLMAIGSAQVIPCLTALVSMYTAAEDQGRILGVFRSLGSLARATGPLLACVIYWRLGGATAYYVVAGLMAVPLIMARSLPEPAPSTNEGEERPSEKATT
jgi:MFS family permease